jgi:uncharacterized protein YcaQ
MTDILSPHAVKMVQLANFGLLAPLERPAAKDDVLSVIRQIGALQIDTISVVARAPYFILWSRLGSYSSSWLEELLAEGQLFEYWAHAACFLPIEDYPLYRRFMIGNLRGYYRRAWGDLHREELDAVLQRIHAEGPLRSADFERKDGKTGGWWNWKMEKEVLEYLFNAGELMIRERRNFQRVYDLTERVLPDWDDARTPSEDEVLDELTVRTVRIFGAAPARWVHDYFRLPKPGNLERLEALVKTGRLLKQEVAGWKEPVYVHPDQVPVLIAAEAGQLEATLTTLLSPFDPIISDRARARSVFGFDYSMEVYLPVEKRQWGYYVLPILHRGNLIGRVDAKANRQAGKFDVKALYLEPNVTVTAELTGAVSAAIHRCAEWHRTPEVTVQNSALALE